MSDVTTKIEELIQTNLRKRVYVALSHPVVPEEEIIPFLPEHLAYMSAHENQIFLSGPFLKEGRLVDEGLTILHTDREEEAIAFMRNEPLVKRGLRTFALKRWEIREGSLTIRLIAGRSEFSLDPIPSDELASSVSRSA